MVAGLIATPFLAGSFVRSPRCHGARLVPFLSMSLRCRSLVIGIYSVTAWNVYAAGLWPGLLRRRIDPADRIESVVIRDAAVSEQAVQRGMRPESRRLLTIWSRLRPNKKQFAVPMALWR